MKIVQIEDVPLRRGLEHRSGTFHSRTTVEGTPGTVGNFKFSLSELGTDYSGPRHRHNFDQLRYMLEGESDYGDGSLRAGQLGYYPEGVAYGPQVNKTPIRCAALQFGGASGSGYLLPSEAKAGMEELKAFGEFADGGTGACNGKDLKQHTTLFLEHGERAKLHASERLEILHYGLPGLSDMTIASNAMAAE